MTKKTLFISSLGALALAGATYLLLKNKKEDTPIYLHQMSDEDFNNLVEELEFL
jgi:hypothetical protein